MTIPRIEKLILREVGGKQARRAMGDFPEQMVVQRSTKKRNFQRHLALGTRLGDAILQKRIRVGCAQTAMMMLNLKSPSLAAEAAYRGPQQSAKL